MDSSSANDSGTLVAKINAVTQECAPPAGLSVLVTSSKLKNPFQFVGGYADITAEKSMKSSNLFGVGSITKVFVAVVVFQLIEEGKLSLSDTVGRYLGDDITRDIENASTATLDRLLNHTAGIDSWEDDPDWIRNGRGELVQPGRIWAKTETLEYIRRPRRTAPPPGTWGYSNTHYTLLGLIIEVVTGSTAEAEIKKRVILPTDMQYTFLEGFDKPEKEGQITGRYHVANEAFRKTAGICPAFPEVKPDIIEAKGYNLSCSWTAGGMISCVDDLQKLSYALTHGKLLKSESWDIMRQWIPTGDDGQEMGHGLFRMQFPSQGKWLGHSGGVLGFSTGLWWHEEQDCCVVVLSNLGTQHCGKVTVGTQKVINTTDFLTLALELASNT